MNLSNFFARYRYMNSAATATGYADALTSWGSTLRGATSMLALGQSTVRSVAPSSARSQASYAAASISSDGCVLGGVALAAAPSPVHKWKGVWVDPGFCELRGDHSCTQTLLPELPPALPPESP